MSGLRRVASRGCGEGRAIRSASSPCWHAGRCRRRYRECRRRDPVWPAPRRAGYARLVAGSLAESAATSFSVNGAPLMSKSSPFSLSFQLASRTYHMGGELVVDPLPRVPGLPAQLRGDAAAVEDVSEGSFAAGEFGEGGEEIGGIDQVRGDCARGCCRASWRSWARGRRIRAWSLSCRRGRGRRWWSVRIWPLPVPLSPMNMMSVFSRSFSASSSATSLPTSLSM